ncbi:MAG: hypothetical protein GPI95_18200 [Microcystis aeruginosa LG13-11]|nr:hypothetical protein [Microcystis aeruginosa LG13-11]
MLTQNLEEPKPWHFRSSISKGSASRRARSFCYSDFPSRRPATDDRRPTPNPTNKLFQQTLPTRLDEEKERVETEQKVSVEGFRGVWIFSSPISHLPTPHTLLPSPFSPNTIGTGKN